MHPRDLAELAALAAVYSPALVREARQAPRESVEQYWVASRCRFDRWTRVLRRLADAGTELPLPATVAWPRVRPVLEEILVGEVLTRVWAAASTACDRARDDSELEPVARNVLAGHLEARHRVLQLLADGRAIAPVHATELNQLRRKAERWCDLLLAHLARDVDITAFAVEPARANEFANDLDYEAVESARDLTSQLIVSSLQASLATGLAEQSPNGDLNRRIGAAVLGCLAEQLPEESPLSGSLWIGRVQAATADTEGLIDELFRIDAPHRRWQSLN
ncbi:MAG: hypothetical protein WD872_16150 [Pirellulaceae bacterium]